VVCGIVTEILYTIYYLDKLQISDFQIFCTHKLLRLLAVCVHLRVGHFRGAPLMSVSKIITN
jgi:hypothetical protein